MHTHSHFGSFFGNLQTDRQIDRYTDRQIDRSIDIYIYIGIYRERDRQIGRQIKIRKQKVKTFGDDSTNNEIYAQVQQLNLQNRARKKCDKTDSIVFIFSHKK